MKADTRKTPLSHIITLVKNDFFGHDAFRNWVSLLCFFLRTIFITCFVIFGCIGFSIFMMTMFLPESLDTYMCSTPLIEVIGLRNLVISMMLNMGLPISVFFTFLIGLGRYLKIRKDILKSG